MIDVFYSLLFVVSCIVAKQLLQDNSIDNFLCDIHALTQQSVITIHCDRKNKLYLLCQTHPSSLLDLYHKYYGTRIKKIHIIQMSENYVYCFVDNKLTQLSDGTYQITFEILFELPSVSIMV